MREKTDKITVGVWMPLHPGLRLRGEGLFRYLSFVAGGLPDNVEFLTYIPPWLAREFQEEMLDLPAEVRKKFRVKNLYWEFSPATILVVSLLSMFKSYTKLTEKKSRRRSKIILKLSYFFNSWRFWFPSSVLMSLLFVGLSIGLAKSGHLIAAAISVTMLAPTLFLGFRYSIRSIVAESVFEKDVQRKPDFFTRVSNALIRRFSAKLEGLAVILSNGDYNKLAKRLGKKPPIDCWYIVNASLRSARWLKGPTVSVFADFMFLSCPSDVPPRALRRLRTDVNRLLNSVDQIICLSDHVKRDHLVQIAGKRALKKVNVIRVAPVSILEDAPYITVVDGMPLKTVDSIREAKRIVNKYIAKQVGKARFKNILGASNFVSDHNLILRYLVDMTSTDTPFVFCSTQNRAYKNVGLIVKAVDELRQKEVPGLRLVMTGQVDYYGRGVPELITERGAIYDFVSLPRVPRPVHAALFHLAAVTVHPSFHEGGTGAFPLWESTSVGTPAVLSRNASSLEDLDLQAMDHYMFDPYSIDEAKEVLLKALNDPQAVLKCQREIILEKAKSGEDWYAVGRRYAEVFEKTIQAYKVKQNKA